MNLQKLVQQDLGVGVGLRAAHFGHILRKRPRVDWFEILSENFMHTAGRQLDVLDEVAAMKAAATPAELKSRRTTRSRCTACR